MDCYRRRWTRNNPCKGSGHGVNPYPDGDLSCYTCQDLARMHQGGYRAPCRTSAVNDAYWNKVATCMMRKCGYTVTVDGTDQEICSYDTTTRSMETPPPEYPTPLTPDGPVGQDHLDWFLWFYVWFVNPANPGDWPPSNPQEIYWLGYPPAVTISWTILGNLINDEWNQDGLNVILDQWGHGSYPPPLAIPSNYNLTTTPQGKGSNSSIKVGNSSTYETKSAGSNGKMNPVDHVRKNENTGMYNVYNKDGRKVKGFRYRAEANKYAIDNHDSLMESVTTTSQMKYSNIESDMEDVAYFYTQLFRETVSDKTESFVKVSPYNIKLHGRAVWLIPIK